MPAPISTPSSTPSTCSPTSGALDASGDFVAPACSLACRPRRVQVARSLSCGSIWLAEQGGGLHGVGGGAGDAAAADPAAAGALRDGQGPVAGVPTQPAAAGGRRLRRAAQQAGGTAGHRLSSSPWGSTCSYIDPGQTTTGRGGSFVRSARRGRWRGAPEPRGSNRLGLCSLGFVTGASLSAVHLHVLLFVRGVCAGPPGSGSLAHHVLDRFHQVGAPLHHHLLDGRGVGHRRVLHAQPVRTTQHPRIQRNRLRTVSLPHARRTEPVRLRQSCCGPSAARHSSKQAGMRGGEHDACGRTGARAGRAGRKPPRRREQRWWRPRRQSAWTRLG
eukprot:scaffold2529_cov363-Prasinococcus_capsulatus_cf.AAC.2